MSFVSHPVDTTISSLRGTVVLITSLFSTSIGRLVFSTISSTRLISSVLETLSLDDEIICSFPCLSLPGNTGDIVRFAVAVLGGDIERFSISLFLLATTCLVFDSACSKGRTAEEAVVSICPPMDDFEAETRDPNIGEKGTGTETGTEAGSRMGKETGTAAGSWMGTVIAAVVVVVGTPCLESLILSILVRVAALVGRAGGGLTAIVGRKLMLLPGPVGVEPKDAATIVSGISAAVGRISGGVQGTDGDNMGHGGSDLGGGDVGEVNGKMAVSVRAICAIIVGEVGEED